MNQFVQPIQPGQTLRQCSECGQRAINFKFKADNLGERDNSSRTPVCEAHTPTAAQLVTA